MSLLQKLQDLIQKAKELKELIENSPVPAGPLTGSDNSTAHAHADGAKTDAQDALDDPTYASITPVLLTYSDDGRADTRAIAVDAWAGEAKDKDQHGDDQGAADRLHSVIETIPDLKFAIDNGVGIPDP